MTQLNREIAKFLRKRGKDASALKDGTVRVRRQYFYHMGRDAQSLGEGCKIMLAEFGLGVEIIDTKDHFNTWPNRSYFEAILRPLTGSSTKFVSSEKEGESQ